MDSLWLDSTNNSLDLNSLNKNIETDICIIGGGIFGLTSAYFLSNLGFKVILLEKNNLVTKTTAHTTGKITSQHGLFYKYLVNSFSKEFAKGYLDANQQAISNIKEIIGQIENEYKSQNEQAYHNILYTVYGELVDKLEEKNKVLQSEKLQEVISEAQEVKKSQEKYLIID